MWYTNSAQRNGYQGRHQMEVIGVCSIAAITAAVWIWVVRCRGTPESVDRQSRGRYRRLYRRVDDCVRGYRNPRLRTTGQRREVDGVNNHRRRRDRNLVLGVPPPASATSCLSRSNRRGVRPVRVGHRFFAVCGDPSRLLSEADATLLARLDKTGVA